jgi:hypothetical protein
LVSGAAAERVTTLPPAELQEAATLLVRAFGDGSLFQFAFPDSATRHRFLQVLFTNILKDAMRFGRVEIAYNQTMAGILIWYPPGRYPVTIARELRYLLQYARVVVSSPLGVLKLVRTQAKLNRIRPKQPHCHGYFLGGRPGEVIGKLLVNRLFDEADKIRAPVYLETQDRRSVNLYTRLGFKMLHDRFETIPGAPLTWTMWREPRVRPGIGQELAGVTGAAQVVAVS